MTRILKLLLLALVSITVSFCSNDDDNPTSKTLSLNISGLENLGADYVYEGWIIVDGKAVTTGRFSVDDNGSLSQTSFNVDTESLNLATTFVLTIEPTVGDVPTPSKVHILAGDFVGDTGQLAINHSAALANDFSLASGKYILATPTDGAMTNENSGIWFLDLSSGAPSVGLMLPDLPDGWKYEGWVVTDGVPVTSGKFTELNTIDEFDGFSSTMGGPPFPGEDYLVNAPAGLTFPTDLAGGKAVISIEPDPDNSDLPFLLKPLVGDIPITAMDHTTYELGQNLNFPTGDFSR